MWKKFTKKSLLRTHESGQGVVEYVLVLMVVFSMFFLVAKPGLIKIQKMIRDDFLTKGNASFLTDNTDTADGFYRFPM